MYRKVQRQEVPLLQGVHCAVLSRLHEQCRRQLLPRGGRERQRAGTGLRDDRDADKEARAERHDAAAPQRSAPQLVCFLRWYH